MSLISVAKMQEFETGELLAFKGRVEAIIGKSLVWEVDLKSFDKTWDGTTYFFELDTVAQSFHKYCFDRLEAVLKQLCETPMIKDMIADKLNGIHISQRSDEEDMYGAYEFKEGTLVMKCAVNTDIGPADTQVEGRIMTALNTMA